MNLSAHGLPIMQDNMPKWIKENKEFMKANPIIEQQNDLNDD
jgi:hypothetical protein